jgi:predicted membrane channel-forming protein YqfA (hemolysin III family)
MSSHEKRCAVLVGISVAAVIALLFTGPIAQDPAYHLFADARELFGISNFWNVFSNLPFLAIGMLGLLRYPRLAHPESAHGYLVLCVGVMMVGLGSAYYHYAPNNATLLWDRLPMAVAFMAFFSLLLNERVFRTPRLYLLWALVFFGAASTLYWSWTESLGRGDLRPYVLVQFLPVLLIPFLLAMFKSRYLNNRLLIASFAFYFLAKVLEFLDPQLFSITHGISGHAVKHLAAALAVLCIIYAVPARSSEGPSEALEEQAY